MFTKGLLSVFSRSGVGRKAISTASSSGAKLAEELAQKAITWTKTKSAEYPYTAEVGGNKVTLKMNDFPEEPLATVIDKAGTPVMHTNDMLSNWHLPGYGNTPKGPM